MDVVERIGRTPLLQLHHVGSRRSAVQILLKAEWFNPGGSVKDRPARQIVLEAEAAGHLRAGKVLLDASSGNTGIAYAMIGASRGHPVEICLPANASVERRRLLAIYGATIILTDPMEGTDGAIREARRRVQEAPERYFYADQYSNPANWRAHYLTTGPEVWTQTGGHITHFVAGLGTSGTMMGTGRYLKEQNRAVQLVAIQPDSPYHGLEGLKHMATAMVPAIFDPGLADLNLEQSTEEAWDITRKLAREEGLLVGVSGGAAVAAALRLAEGLSEGMIVVVVPDGGLRYLSEPHWEI